MIGALLLSASGVDTALARACGEQRRYTIYGGLVLFTTGVATASMAYAANVATGAPPIVTGLVALFWGFGVFHIDQWLVTAHTEGDGLAARLWLLLPRLAIALPMGLTISWFVMLGIAAKEIDHQLYADLLVRVDQEKAISSNREQQKLTNLEQQLRNLEDGVDRARTHADAARQAFDDEASGRGGTGLPGLGREAKDKRAQWLEAHSELETATHAADAERPILTANIFTTRARIQKETDAIERTDRENDGLFARQRALDRAVRDDAGAAWLRGLLEVVFVAVDLVPAVAKVFSPTSLVDIAYRDRRRTALAEGEAQADADRRSPDVIAARDYLASQQAERIRARADALRTAPRPRRRRPPVTRWRPY